MCFSVFVCRQSHPRAPSSTPYSIIYEHCRGDPTSIVAHRGELRAGTMTSPAPSSPTSNSSASGERFNSLDFTPHLMVSSLAFGSLYEGMEVTHGKLRSHVGTLGTIRLPDLICPTSSDMATPPIFKDFASPSSVGSTS
jgi:hypothetical protein